jgi:hypothetical protein
VKWRKRQKFLNDWIKGKEPRSTYFVTKKKIGDTPVSVNGNFIEQRIMMTAKRLQPCSKRA